MAAADIVQRARIQWYRRMWTCERVTGRPAIRTPLVVNGEGTVRFGDDITVGWAQTGAFYTTYAYLEARYASSSIELGDRCFINNDAAIVSEGEGITIGSTCLIGVRVQIYDSDFHALGLGRVGPPRTAPAFIGDDVMLSTGCMVLKGSHIGDGATVGAGAVVSGQVAAGAIVAGNPAREVRR